MYLLVKRSASLLTTLAFLFASGCSSVRPDEDGNSALPATTQEHGLSNSYATTVKPGMRYGQIVMFSGVRNLLKCVDNTSIGVCAIMYENYQNQVYICMFNSNASAGSIRYIRCDGKESLNKWFVGIPKSGVKIGAKEQAFSSSIDGKFRSYKIIDVDNSGQYSIVVTEQADQDIEPKCYVWDMIKMKPLLNLYDFREALDDGDPITLHLVEVNKQYCVLLSQYPTRLVAIPVYGYHMEEVALDNVWGISAVTKIAKGRYRGVYSKMKASGTTGMFEFYASLANGRFSLDSEKEIQMEDTHVYELLE